ncbi:MAG TPA: serine hydrolase domain-containing protein [Vicinamibacterales bacterium]|jgi:CubicO group peptidase (beta-lactamase class C family)
MSTPHANRRFKAALVLTAALAFLPAALATLGANGTFSAGSARQVAQPPKPSPEARVDAVFARWTTATPGCAVAVSVDDKTVLERAYGMADLEHGVINTPETIFEAGSVSKQFTAAAVLLLTRDGKLALDDAVRKYVPELPDYGSPLTIRMMLQHTSGLRDWGAVAGIGGWPRTSRVYTHAHVLEIASRQRALNFQPGTDWSYSNTGYNLAAIVVARVSGQPFAEFTRQRVFAPVGMTHTSWRDDFTRIVRGRAIAYSEQGGRFATEMPFENVHGNGGLLTTVADLLTWNGNFAAPKVGDAEFVRLQEEPGRFTDGRRHDYGLGLFVGQYKGLREISHSGSTAGYQAFLTRFPDERLSVAVLCNSASAAAGRYAHAVADIYLGERARNPEPVEGIAIAADQLDLRAGLYRSTRSGAPLTIQRDQATLRVAAGLTVPAGSSEAGPGTFVPLSASRFVSADGGRTLEFAGEKGARLDAANGTGATLERAIAVKPTPTQLAEYAGSYSSDEAEVTMTAVVENGELRLKRRPDVTVTLKPAYADAFVAPIGTVIFRRDGSGRVVTFSIVQDRVWDLKFTRQEIPQGR